jgi:hypothetical protein
MIATLLAAWLAAPATGLYFEQTTLLREEGRDRAPGVRSRVWCQGPRMRLEPADSPGGPALVLRLDEGRALRLDPEAKLATELDVEQLRARSHSDASVAAGLMGGPGEGPLRTAALREPRTIAGHLCRGFRIKGENLTADVWVARDLPVRADVFADFLEWSGAAHALGTTRETVSTVTAIRATRIPRTQFEVPAGWRTVREPAAQPAVP